MKIRELYEALRKESLYPDLYEKTENIIVASVSWGDWKHEHLYLDVVMGRLGYTLIEVKITEEDGSDCYSADRVYVKS